jgi:hypothetical protein
MYKIKTQYPIINNQTIIDEQIIMLNVDKGLRI